ncbi:MAG: hypothetical protein KF683_08305 [Rubrivivax sp.]|nr:hypothetical protein [Rubrivivax sp.]
MNLDRKVFASCLVALLGVSAAATAQASTVPAEGLQDSVVPAVRYRAAQDGHAAIKLQVTPHAARSAHESAGHGVGAGRIEAERKVFLGGNTEAERKVFIGGNVEAQRKVFIGGNVEAERKVFIGGNVEAERRFNGCC